MPKRPATSVTRSQREPSNKEEMLKDFLRTKQNHLLRMKNVSSVGVGYREKAGKSTGDLCIQVTVEHKVKPEAVTKEGFVMLNMLAEEEQWRLPDGSKVAIDIVQRKYQPSFRIISDPDAKAQAEESTAREQRRSRLDTVIPGVSVSNVAETAGTFGAVVFDNESGEPYVLSNWHVLHGPSGKVGDSIVQPGPYDDGNVNDNIIGKLVRSHLGLAGDCAVASLTQRAFKEEILELNVTPKRVATVNLGDTVVKSGRTTGVTYGVVRRVGVVVKIDYGGGTGIQEVGGFEIGPDPNNPAPNGEVSMGGDSGSLWLIYDQNNREATDIAVGLHFAGETDPDPAAEHAVACNIHSVLEKLNVSFVERDEALMDEEELWNWILSLISAQSAHLRDLETELGRSRGGLPGRVRPGIGGRGAAESLPSTREGLPVYGNWCGPGHGGGTPVDDLDRACMEHDRCYGERGYFDCQCDATLVQNIDRALVSGNVRPAGRVVGPAIRTWFSAQPCVVRAGGIPIPAGTGGAVAGVTSVVRGGKKLWKKIKGWF